MTRKEAKRPIRSPSPVGRSLPLGTCHLLFGYSQPWGNESTLMVITLFLIFRALRRLSPIQPFHHPHPLRDQSIPFSKPEGNGTFSQISPGTDSTGEVPTRPWSPAPEALEKRGIRRFFLNSR